MNKIVLFTLLSSFACSVTAKDEPMQDFKNIFHTISAKNALSTSFREHIRKMRPLCTQRAESDPDYLSKGTARRDASSGVLKLNMSGTADPAVTMIDATITGIGKCPYMRALLIQQYGKPARSKGSCDSEWVVARGKNKPLVHVVLVADAKENVVYFTNQEEQGP